MIDLAKKGIEEVHPQKPVMVIPTEAEAIAYAINHAREGSFIVDCSEKINEALATVTSFLDKQTGRTANAANASEPASAIVENI